MINIFPTDQQYSNYFIKVINNEELSDTERHQLSRYEVNIEEKAKQEASIIKNMILESEAIKSALTDIEKKYEDLINKIEKAKFELKNLLEINSINNIKTPYFEIKIHKNPHSTKILDSSVIPQEYIKETLVKTINKKQILDDLKLGVIIPGVELKQDNRLEIK